MNEAEVLFSSVLNRSRMSLYIDRDKLLTKDESGAIAAALKRRISGEPLEYILGKTEFMGLEFKVSPAVLIPRPETEILVETVLSCCIGGPCLKILDLGTGSGCIAVSLAKFLPDAEITAVDISKEALAIAAENARLNNTKVNFMRSDLFSALPSSKYDVIVSNPPYVSSGEITGLQPELKHEPFIALAGGSDGLDFYRHIINVAPDHLEPAGLLIMEIGFGQRRDIEGLIKGSKKFEVMKIVKDYNNIDRVIAARERIGG
ncbi:MAG: peptide chain release factor N(5)-glutamine methyltransferase [Candidatus Omnitrophota bacterium]